LEVEDRSNRSWIIDRANAEAKALGDFLHGQIVGQDLRIYAGQFFIPRRFSRTVRPTVP
jgi:hypothetical protein